MKAPKKIYLEAIYPDNGTLPIGLNYTPSPTDIEYTRTDAFIKKACEFIKERFYFDDSWHTEGETCISDKVIEDFKKYMEE